MNNKIIISELGVNKHFIPITLKKSKNDLIIYNKKGIPMTCIKKNSIWDIYCYKTIDYITSLIRKEFETWCMNENKIDDKVLIDIKCHSIYHVAPMIRNYYFQKIENISKEHPLYNISYTFSFDDALQSPIFKGLTKTNIKYILNKISNYFIKTNYHILTQSDNFNFSFEKSYCNLNSEYDRLFHITYKKGKTERKIARLNFGTCLGSCFLHNIYTKGWKNINKKIYKLSTPAHILYRMNFLTYSFKIQFDFKKTCQYLNINNVNKSILYKKFINIFDELVDNKLITIVEYNKKNKFIICKKI